MLFYYDVLIKLLKSPLILITYCQAVLRHMTAEQIMRRFNVKTVTAEGMSEILLLNMLEKFREALTDDRLQELLKCAKQSSFAQIKLKLYEMDHDYLKCLRVIMRRKQFDSALDWISERLQTLNFKAASDSKDNKLQKSRDSFEKEVLSWGLYLFKHDAQGTVKMFE